MPASDSWITAVTDSKIPKNATYIKEFGGTTYAAIYGAQTHAIPLEWDEMIEVVIYNWDAGLHPFHVSLETFPPTKRDIFELIGYINPASRTQVPDRPSKL